MTEQAETNLYEGVSDVDGAADALSAKWERELDANPEPMEEGEPQQPVAEAEPEVEGSDDESEQPEAEEEAEVEETESEESDEPALYTVNIGGEEKKVTLDELRSGFMLQGDYTRKTQEVAEARKKITDMQQQVSQQATQQFQQLGFLVDQMVNNLTTDEQNTNWEELRQLDPAEYTAKREYMAQRKEQLNQAFNLYQQHQAQQQQFQQQSLQSKVSDEAVKMIGSIPQWSDPQVREREAGELRNYLMGHGFSEEEIGGIVDHRHVVQLRKAMLYDQLQGKQAKLQETAKSKKLKDLPKVRAGTAQDPENRNSKAEKTMKQLRKSGSTDDAADWLMSRMG